MPISPSNAEEAAIITARVARSGQKLCLFNVKAADRVNISTITVSGTTATVTLTGSHGWAQDDLIQMASVTPAIYNDHFRIASDSTYHTANPTKFQVKVPSGTAGGSAYGWAGKWTEIAADGVSGYNRFALTSTDWNAAVGGSPTVMTGPKSGVSWTFGGTSPSYAGFTANLCDSDHPCVGIQIYDTGTSAFTWPGLITSPTTININDTVVFDSSNIVTIEAGNLYDPF